MKKRILGLALSLIMISGSVLYLNATPKIMPDGEVFDPVYYAANNPDVVSALGSNENNLYLHYKIYGIRENRKPIQPTTASHAKSSSKVPSNTYVGKETAKKQAVEYSGLTTASVVFTKIKEDWDDGRREYEIEYIHDGKKYEVEVTSDGKIVSYEVDRLNTYQKDTTNNNSSVSNYRYWDDDDDWYDDWDDDDDWDD